MLGTMAPDTWCVKAAATVHYQNLKNTTTLAILHMFPSSEYSMTPYSFSGFLEIDRDSTLDLAW